MLRQVGWVNCVIIRLVWGSETAGACSRPGADERCVQNFDRNF